MRITALPLQFLICVYLCSSVVNVFASSFTRRQACWSNRTKRGAMFFRPRRPSRERRRLTPSSPAAPTPPVDDTIKVGLIGCGGRGSGAASQALSTTNGPMELVAVADAFADNAKNAVAAIKAEHSDKREGRTG